MRAAFEDVLAKRRIHFEKNVKTSSLCTFRIGGTCDYLIEPRCQGELVDAVMLCRHFKIPYEIIGRGSNLLFPDGELPLALIRTTRLVGVRREGSDLIADCGVTLPYLARRLAALGFEDLAFACGIPGTLGGGVYMNAGAYGKDLGGVIKWGKVLDATAGEIRTFFNKELSFSYRNSAFQRDKHIILQVCLSLKDRCDPDVAATHIQSNLTRRAATQPLHLPSAGSVFRRPPTGEPVSRVIDELGLKGMRCGGAAVSCKHAGFIVNQGDATAENVECLIAATQAIVKKKRGFLPEVEIQRISSEGRR